MITPWDVDIVQLNMANRAVLNVNMGCDMKENQFQKDLIDQLYSQGAWVFNIHGHSMQKPGVPDLLVVHRRWSGFIELKVEVNETSDKQKDVAKDLIKRYFPTFVIRCAMGMGPGRHVDVWDPVGLTIEDFNGEVLCRPAGLDKVLDCLQALTQQTRDWEKIPKNVADAMRTCRGGDVVFYAGKRFLCEGKM